MRFLLKINKSSFLINLFSCIEKSCLEIEPLEHGRIECTGDNKYGSICNFFCDKGFGLIGNSSTRCTSEGVYDTTDVTCIRE